ncbi:hypothetical protein C8R46DRAFT_483462 [Mycena filopes]|nr:hypothetical protein C8R46DRAFT_483462 [Mycena filopes]
MKKTGAVGHMYSRRRRRRKYDASMRRWDGGVPHGGVRVPRRDGSGLCTRRRRRGPGDGEEEMSPPVARTRMYIIRVTSRPVPNLHLFRHPSCLPAPLIPPPLIAGHWMSCCSARGSTQDSSNRSAMYSSPTRRAPGPRFQFQAMEPHTRVWRRRRGAAGGLMERDVTMRSARTVFSFTGSGVSVDPRAAKRYTDEVEAAGGAYRPPAVPATDHADCEVGWMQGREKETAGMMGNYGGGRAVGIISERPRACPAIWLSSARTVTVTSSLPPCAG